MAIGLITGLATSLLGTGMSIAQMVQANKQKKAAQNAALEAKKRIESISSENPFAALKVPEGAYTKAMDTIKSQASQGLQALQGAGAESLIGGVGNLTQGVKDAALDVGSGLAEAQYQLKRDQAAIQEEMNKRKEQRLGELYSSELQGAGIAAGEAQANKNAAVSGMFESIGGGVAAGLGALPLFAPEGKDWDKWFGNTTTTPEV
jgi:hypothetical protein